MPETTTTYEGSWCPREYRLRRREHPLEVSGSRWWVHFSIGRCPTLSRPLGVAALRILVSLQRLAVILRSFFAIRSPCRAIVHNLAYTQTSRCGSKGLGALAASSNRSNLPEKRVRENGPGSGDAPIASQRRNFAGLQSPCRTTISHSVSRTSSYEATRCDGFPDQG